MSVDALVPLIAAIAYIPLFAILLTGHGNEGTGFSSYS